MSDEPENVRFRIGGAEYGLPEPWAVALAENLLANDPDGEGARRAVARRIERALVDPASGPIDTSLLSPHEVSALDRVLDHMLASTNQAIAILLRAIHRDRGYPVSELLDALADGTYTSGREHEPR